MNSKFEFEQELTSLLEPSIFHSIDENPFSSLQSDQEDQFQGNLFLQKDPDEEIVIANYFELVNNYLTCYEAEDKNKINFSINFNDIWKFYYDVEIYQDENEEILDDEEQIYFLTLHSKEEIHFLYCDKLTEYKLWIEKLKTKCILSNFGNFYSQKEMKKIGGNLFQFTNIFDQKEYIVKIFNLKTLQSPSYKSLVTSLRNEIIILRNLKHKNLIELKEVYEGKTNLYLVFEQLKGQSLATINPSTLKTTEAEQIMEQKKELINVIEYLNHKGISHKNICPACLVFRNDDYTSEIVLCNFNLNSKKHSFGLSHLNSDFEKLENCFKKIIEQQNSMNQIRF